MKELIKIQNNGISAKELYDFLFEGKPSTKFSMWFGRRSKEYSFKEGIDFIPFLGQSSGGRPVEDYALSISMAKELCMVEKNEKGKQARQYFIEVENRYKQQLLRDSSKLTRRGLTDIIQDSGENEKQHGFAYSNYTKLIYKKLGIEYTKEKNFRDSLNEKQLKAIESLENLAKSYIELGYDYSQIKQVLPEIITNKEKKEVTE